MENDPSEPKLYASNNVKLNEPFLQPEIIQIPNPILGFGNKNPKYVEINENMLKERKDFDQCDGYGNENILYENVQFDFKKIEQIIKQDDLRYNSIRSFLEHYSEVEKIILAKIKVARKEGGMTKFNKLILKEMAYHLLDDKVREFPKIRVILEQIRIIRDNFFKDISSGKIKLLDNEEELITKFKQKAGEDIKASVKFFIDKEQNKKVNESLKLLKLYYKKYYQVFKDRLIFHFKVTSFPDFLIREIECKLKRKVNRQLIPKFKELYLKYNFYNSKEYLLVVDYIDKIGKGEMELFCEKLLNFSVREAFFKIICFNLMSVLQEINSLKTKNKVYTNAIEKYATLMHIDTFNVDNFNQYVSENYKQNTLEETMKFFFGEIKNQLGDDLQLYIFSILSVTLMLSNYDITNRRIASSEIETREKECLNRTLIYFTKYGTIENCDLWKFSQVLQSTIYDKYFSGIIEETCIDMTMDGVEGIDLKNEAFHKAKNKIPFITINQKIVNCSDSTIINEYRSFMEKVPNKKNKNSCQKFGEFLQAFFLPFREKKTFVNMSYTKLIPYDKSNSSSQTCIIIHGFIASHQNLYTQWENFIVDFDCYVDFFFYTWDSKTVSKIVKDVLKFLGGLSLTILTRNFLKVFEVYRTYQHKNNVFAKTTKISTYAGKLLAYILASKAFFEHKAITLVGFSLGAHVIKHTLKELHRIAEYCPFVKNIIQNIVFIGGATSIDKTRQLWRNTKEYVAGRMINIYNPNDEVLTGIFKYIIQKDPIGVSPLKLEGNNVENYDFSDLKIKHVEYWDYSNIIIKKINLF